MSVASDRPDPRDLVLERDIPVPAHLLYRCWTEPALLTRWFTPPPFTTPAADLDVRPGGCNCITMRSGEGDTFDLRGVYLEVVPNERLVMTDAYVRAWETSEKPFVTIILTFEDRGGTTRYTARVRHWTEQDKADHEARGFHEGWGVSTDQLTEVARSLMAT